jgi:hypothetical protein
MGSARDGPVKIGFAKNPQGRQRELQTGAPRQLHLFWTIQCGSFCVRDIERVAHEMLLNHRLAGEWFDIPVEHGVAALIVASEAWSHDIKPGSEEFIRIAHSFGLNRQWLF